jgi:hypothetical protein
MSAMVLPAGAGSGTKKWIWSNTIGVASAGRSGISSLSPSGV